jgi:hypothetical protein
MKRLILPIIGVTIVSLTGLANAQQAIPQQTLPQAGATRSYPPSVVDGIAVPFDVDMYVQTQYQGSAITEASKQQRNGAEIYRLRIDRDDDKSDYESFYLLYSLEWKLIGKDTAVPPPKPKAETKVEQPSRQTEEKKPEGGRGSGEGQSGRTEPEPTPAPTPTPVSEETDDTTGQDGSGTSVTNTSGG